MPPGFWTSPKGPRLTCRGPASTVVTVISELLFDQAQELIREVSESKGERGGGKNKYLLSRKIVDTETNRAFVGYPREKGGFGYRRKAFTDPFTRRKYSNKEVTGEELDAFVWQYIKMAIEEPERFYTLYQEQTLSTDKLEGLKEERLLLIENIQKQQQKMAKIDDDFYEGNISEEARFERIEVCRNAIKASEKKYAEIEREISSIVRSTLAKGTVTD